MKLSLIPSTSPILRKESKKIEKITVKTKELAGRMHFFMLQEKGVGLAAPQIGRNICLITINTFSYNKEIGIKRTIINPEIVDISEDIELGTEGCLSYPGEFREINRPKIVTIEYTTLDNERITETFEGFNARVILHEYDHLEGIVFTDYKTP